MSYLPVLEQFTELAQAEDFSCYHLSLSLSTAIFSLLSLCALTLVVKWIFKHAYQYPAKLILLELSSVNDRVMMNLSDYHFSDFYLLQENIQAPTQLMIAAGFPRPSIELNWLNYKIELTNGGQIILPSKVFLGLWQFRKVTQIIAEEYMVNFFIKHYDMLSPVVFSTSGQVANGV